MTVANRQTLRQFIYRFKISCISSGKEGLRKNDNDIGFYK